MNLQKSFVYLITKTIIYMDILLLIIAGYLFGELLSYYFNPNYK